MKKRWFMVSLIIGVLALGITGGAVLAHERGSGGESPWKSFASRVATILELDEAQVQDAFDQAKKEIQDEALQNKLDRLVEEGQLTQEQADEYKEWYLSRPEGLSPGFRGHSFHGGFRRGGFGFHHGVPAEPTPDNSETSIN